MKDPIENCKGLAAFTIFICMALTGLVMSFINMCSKDDNKKNEPK